MTDHDRDKQFDELLDTMLSAYSDAEPRPGLEGRVLAGVRAAQDEDEGRTRTAWWRWKWLWAGAAVAAAVVVLAALWMGRGRVPSGKTVAGGQPAPTQKQGQSQAQPLPEQPLPEQPRRQAATPAGESRGPRVQRAEAGGGARHRRGTNAPNAEDVALARSQRPSVFPTPVPLSDQERLMLRYLARTPREEIVAQSHPDEPAMDRDGDSIAEPDLLSVPQKYSNTR